MKKIVSLALIALLAVGSFTSCKKYEDGPTISFASKKSRVVNTWKIDEEIYDGNTVTLTADQKAATVEFKKDGSVVYTSGSMSYAGTWAFADSKKELQITFAGTTSTSTILKLKSKELWLKSTDSQGKTDETHYVPA